MAMMCITDTIGRQLRVHDLLGQLDFPVKRSKPGSIVWMPCLGIQFQAPGKALGT